MGSGAPSYNHDKLDAGPGTFPSENGPVNPHFPSEESVVSPYNRVGS